MEIFIIGNILPVSLLEHNGAQSIDPSVAHGMIGGTFALNLFFVCCFMMLEPTVDLTKPEKGEEAEVGGGVHGGDLVRDALLLSVVHLVIIIVVIIIIIVVRQRPRV